MPILDWIGKEVVVNHDKEVPFRLLKKVKSVSVGENSQNLIIHGDNLEALKALMPYYQGRIKCIYIDPPYNTGNEGWVYNDKVDSPKIKKWLGKVVGSDLEDLCRHDKWLCMMYPRLKLLKDLLSEDGVLFVSIDDNELEDLKYIMNDLFGKENIEIMIWEKVSSNEGKFKIVKRFRTDHEYILVGYKNKDITNFIKVEELPFIEGKSSNPDNDPRGDWISGNFSTREEKSNKNSPYYYTIASPNGKKFTREWNFDKEEFEKLNSDGRIYWGDNGNNVPRLKVFVNEPKPVFISSIIRKKGTAKSASIELLELFDIKDPNDKIFPNPKPIQLIKYLLKFNGKKNSLVLDSFAGSGTTGHAVLELNKEDGGNRKFIMIQLDEQLKEPIKLKDGVVLKEVIDITRERVRRAIKKIGYNDGFEYCELDKQLFNEDGQIEGECTFDQLATYIYFTETNTNANKEERSGNFIGEYNEIGYYLIFKEKDKNVLNKEFLKKLQKDNKKKVIYADKCLIDDKTLEKYKIQFKQIPYEVKVY
jgi:DNA modification methylase